MEALGERVDDRDADAVQAAGDFVAAAVAELAAGVQGGEDHLGRGPLLFLQFVDRDAAAVVDDRAAVVRVQDDPDAVAVAGDRLVDGVVDDLVDEVVEAARAGRADVHAGALAHRLEPFEDGDVLGPIGAGARFFLAAAGLGFLSQLVPSGSHRKPRPGRISERRSRGRIELT